MNATDLPLRDIHLPEPVGWWPPAPGWWALAAAALLALLLAAWLRWRRSVRRRAPVALARAELAALREDFRQHADPVRLARDVSTWLRRVAMSLCSREQAAGLTGTTWWSFLDDLAGRPVFAAGHGRLISEGPYRRTADVDAERLLSVCESWLVGVARRREP